METKDYHKDELTITWNPSKCTHAAVCVKTLPNVYKPKEKPWINTDNASTQELMEQIKNCPSGALSYKLIE